MRNRVGRIHRRAYPLVVATTCNSLVVVRRYDFIVYQVFAPRSRRGTTPPMSSHVGCLHGGPDSCCLHSGQLILDCDHASNWFRPVFAQWQTERGGGVLLTPSSCGCRFPRRACSLVSTTASFSLVFPALAARPAGRCLPGHTHKLSTTVYIGMFRLCICLPGRRLNSRQTHYPLVAINRHAFILPRRFTTGMPLM